MPTVAIVIPVFNEEAVLPALFERLNAVFALQPATCSWRAILVDDGSRDRSAALIRAHAAADPRWELIELSRNFGFQAALAAGLAHAANTGADAAVTLDADLQDPPELIPQLVAAWLGGAEVVRAVRHSRAEAGLRRAGFDLFHRVFGSLTDYPIEPNTGTFGLLGRHALAAFTALPERHRFFPGLRAWIGFTTADVGYDRAERAAGKAAGQRHLGSDRACGRVGDRLLAARCACAGLAVDEMGDLAGAHRGLQVCARGCESRAC